MVELLLLSWLRIHELFIQGPPIAAICIPADSIAIPVWQDEKIGLAQFHSHSEATSRLIGVSLSRRPGRNPLAHPNYPLTGPD